MKDKKKGLLQIIAVLVVSASHTRQLVTTHQQKIWKIPVI